MTKKLSCNLTDVTVPNKGGPPRHGPCLKLIIFCNIMETRWWFVSFLHYHNKKQMIDHQARSFLQQSKGNEQPAMAHCQQIMKSTNTKTPKTNEKSEICSSWDSNSFDRKTLWVLFDCLSSFLSQMVQAFYPLKQK